MEFRNLTPFAAMQFQMLDRQNNENYVVVFKVGYRLEPDDSGGYRVRVRDDDSVGLNLQDEYLSAINTSSIVQENDLAPFKPLCDVIISGTACANNSVPVLKQSVSVNINDSEGGSLLEKQLSVSGKCYFRKNATNRNWSMTEPEPFIRQPVVWESAFGGECRINATDNRADSVPKADCLTEIQKASHPDSEHLPLAHHLCENNPLGRGFITPWYAHAYHIDHFPAPQITDPRYPFTAEDFASLIAGNADLTAPQFQPAGLGFSGRAWQARRQKAGTYDEIWLNERHPGLPADFDFSYWNAAPADQQIPFPKLPLFVTLRGFSPAGKLSFTLPHHAPFLLLRLDNGTMIPVDMNLDTLHIDTDNLEVTMSWRCVFSATAPVRVAEARYETEPENRFEKLYGLSMPERSANAEVPAHG